ncbi:MAG: hypothetical protein AB7Q17_04175 [Phycisphaerae bacterium]
MNLAWQTRCAVLLACSAALAGCEAERNLSPPETFSGVVASRDAQLGELVVQVRGPGGPRQPATRLCVVTKDSEIYLNGQLITLDRVEPGDTVELFVTRDHAAGMERFAVMFAQVARPGPTPVPPPLPRRFPASTRPRGETE